MLQKSIKTQQELGENSERFDLEGLRQPRRLSPRLMKTFEVEASRVFTHFLLHFLLCPLTSVNSDATMSLYHIRCYRAVCVCVCVCVCVYVCVRACVHPCAILLLNMESYPHTFHIISSHLALSFSHIIQ